MVNEKIEERYKNETETKSLGCGNLKPFLNIKTGDIVLDLGCGNGGFTYSIVESVGDDGKIYALDLTREMIEKAIANNSHKNIRYTVGDINNLPYQDNFFDLIISNCVINHSTNKSLVFSEIYRVLKKSGHFLIADIVVEEALPKEISSDPKYIAQCFGGAIPKKEYFTIINNVGFKKIKECSSRKYIKFGFPMESLIIQGEKE
ncbi:MAG: hypothetical protein A2086_13590 [Spirochaetes bacterium GWD1_27_9]|nr:MAG: hypothetical protein A2Z98_08100 [Spirochaetes bacterium GWB1_27_13]OHD23630.1 MAG: hypothetical protein A2Y34_01080 [Spirochaetes bacterium GWC1_27_15]OHD39259.1 MAG: hypothetical protein A2086_13590 [Spirochaetes bacterium GWD1_27_9]